MWIDQKSVDPARVMNLSVGLASPLWPTFFVAATTGMAYWWMAGLARQSAVNEAVAATIGARPSKKAHKVIEAEVSVVEDATTLVKDEVAVLEAVADLPVAAPEPVAVEAVEAAPVETPVAIEAAVEPEPAVVEAAPVAEVVAEKPVTPRKPRAKKASL